ncbi:MAG: diaminopimelate epimerase [Bacteroidales bacterium]|nr:diaminopimelate epimerase [Bacteroidales bacterium]
MKHTIHFAKMQGAGNDYIYVDTSLYPISDPSGASIKWSDRHNGIGADGLVLIGKSSSDKADFTMRIFNADGSEADMCGNASRCIGKYVYEHGLSHKKLIRLQTASGIKNLWLKISDSGDTVENVIVDMLEPAVECREQFAGTPGKETVLKALGRKFIGMFVSMGNPHFVVFCDDADTIDIAAYGAALEKNAAFPQRCNIEFAKVITPERIRTRVWERGSGITKACGTGACATAVAAMLCERSSNKVTIEMDGGNLDIEWNPPAGHVYLSGPAEFVYEGDIEYGTC